MDTSEGNFAFFNRKMKKVPSQGRSLAADLVYRVLYHHKASIMQRLTILFWGGLALLITAGTIDLNELFNYSDQPVPPYILQDNTPADNPITDAGATLGRVLFYDHNLSANNAVSCASCHQQAFAFGDNNQTSAGLEGGPTARHSMRLVNTRHAEEVRFFWDERAESLEAQTTMPIQDHIEMGFSGEDGDPGIDSLISKLSNINYYETLFTFAFGDATITEERMQLALAQFIRSIQSYDSRFDEGLALVPNLGAPFPNFTAEENLGKQLFLTPPPAGGAGCQGCHRAPEFDIDPASLNNGVIGVAGNPGEIDLTVTRAPSLRNVFNPNGVPNGPFMHTGNFNSMLQVLNHYDSIPNNPANTNLDPRLEGPPGPGNQVLNLSDEEKQAIIAFLRTLTGEDLYTNPQWSDPFDPDGTLEIIPFCQEITNILTIELCDGENFEGYDQSGTYTDVYTDQNGCDSTRILELTIGDPIESLIDMEICQGDTLEGYFESGLYVDVFVAANGCDSTRTLALFVLPADDPDCLVNGTQAAPGSTYRIGPNPFQESLTVEASHADPWTLLLYDAQGRIQLARTIANSAPASVTLDVRGLLPGAYFLVGLGQNGERILAEQLIKMQ